MLTYLDRVSFGSAAGDVQESLGLDNIGQLKWAFTAFTISYAACEIPTGWLGDVYGPRKTLIRIVLWWSAFTALTGSVSREGLWFLSGLSLMVLIRFLFGVGEAGAYPNITRALHNWFPFRERGSAQGAVWMAGRLMGGLTPVVWWALVPMLGLPWQTAFVFFGVIGVVWCVLFAVWFRNRPEEHPAVNDAELNLIRHGGDVKAAHANVPWLKLLTNINLWALCLMYFCGAFGWYFFITYLPKFLETQFHVEPDDLLGSIYKGGPLLFGAASCLVGGWLSDQFIRRTGNRKWGRRLFGVVGHGLCAASWFVCLFMPSAFLFALTISLAAFWNDLTMGASWATCQDIGKRYAAIVAGCMNTIGNLGGAAAGWLTGTILEHRLEAYRLAHDLAENDKLPADVQAAVLLPAYHLCFVLFGLVYVVAVALWLRIDSTQVVAPEAEE
jgi:MFS family permease